MFQSKYHKWAEEEELLLVELLKEHGQQWDFIRKAHFRRFTFCQVRSKYYMLLKYKPTMVDPNYVPDPQKVMEEEVYRKVSQILKAMK